MKKLFILGLLVIGCNTNYIYEIIIRSNAAKSKIITKTNSLKLDTISNSQIEVYRHGYLYDSGFVYNGKRNGFHKLSRICINEEFAKSSFFENWHHTSENYFLVYFIEDTIYQVSAPFKDSIVHIVKINETNDKFQLKTADYNQTEYGIFISSTNTYLFFNLSAKSVYFRFKSKDLNIDTTYKSQNMPFLRLRDERWDFKLDSVELIN
ncbi:MAG: hypothetical protein IT244_00435 [Bacteroidia bacterium]|nr:hypothetical protein [Bacteroidia bacterium]